MVKVTEKGEGAMFCCECGTPTTQKAATIEKPYRYEESGLENVYLAGITIFHCPNCMEETASIPRLLELHSVIAGNLIRKEEQLAGDEVRFLRKWVGLPAKEFAAMLCVTPSHLSRVENGKTKRLGWSVDKLARAIVSEASQSEYTKTILMGIAKDRIEEQKVSKKTKLKAPVFRLVKNHWGAAA
jgi:DNA-binding transcriptional regulator YiaG